MSSELKPSIPPTRRDILIAVFANANNAGLVGGLRLEKLMNGLAKTGISGAEEFEGFNRRVIIETTANLSQNGLIAPQGITDEGREYADLVEPDTLAFIRGFVAGAEHMEERLKDC